MVGTGPTDLLQQLDLKEYEATALAHLLSAGRTTAPDISDATDIPQARVYGVLESLADYGFIEVIPGRPKQYQPKSPEEILERAKENRRQRYEDYCAEIEDLRGEFLEVFGPRYERADGDVTPTSELFHVVDVGQPSETETRQLYRNATDGVYVITNSFAYFDDIEPAVEAALEEDTPVSVLFLDQRHLPAEKAATQAEIVDRIASDFPAIEYRFSKERLPWRGTFVDPSMDYDSGKAIFLVEETDVPNHRRQAAITENGSFVAGMKRYFDLIWEYESLETRPEL
ncbi:TrmB family transcriptional regulator [Halopiger xanaduensis]|uniref:Transcriptional regulator, TrmB n=1 Tax=Halopiger xanaduensis (strain DSM 18323 / JCM 14033 / SH-6) TaxID=797210 RepID=F8DA47_HALXS|nr:helix-turn-helix domain-containing protein [Halopiger xanaduensis]AEH36972.1 transcriptional regulator, TrmB [Halopiger xanaduensis SH-6]